MITQLTVMSGMFVVHSIILKMVLNMTMVIMMMVQNALRVATIEHVSLTTLHTSDNIALGKFWLQSRPMLHDIFALLGRSRNSWFCFINAQINFKNFLRLSRLSCEIQSFLSFIIEGQIVRRAFFTIKSIFLFLHYDWI